MTSTGLQKWISWPDLSFKEYRPAGEMGCNLTMPCVVREGCEMVMVVERQERQFCLGWERKCCLNTWKRADIPRQAKRRGSEEDGVFLRWNGLTTEWSCVHIRKPTSESRGMWHGGLRANGERWGQLSKKSGPQVVWIYPISKEGPLGREMW